MQIATFHIGEGSGVRLQELLSQNRAKPAGAEVDNSEIAETSPKTEV
jgi:hypothetical protein